MLVGGCFLAGGGSKDDVIKGIPVTLKPDPEARMWVRESSRGSDESRSGD